MLRFETVQEVLDKLEDKFKNFSDSAVEELTDVIQSITWNELASFQVLQTESHAGQKIDLDTASWLYNCLGGETASVQRWQELSLHEQYTVMEVIKLLHKARIQ